MSSGKVVFKDERFPTPLGRNEVVKVQVRHSRFDQICTRYGERRMLGLRARCGKDKMSTRCRKCVYAQYKHAVLALSTSLRARGTDAIPAAKRVVLSRVPAVKHVVLTRVPASAPGTDEKPNATRRARGGRGTSGGALHRLAWQAACWWPGCWGRWRRRSLASARSRFSSHFTRVLSFDAL
eukprot:2609763-Rhodomonas_salina.2